MRKKWLGVFSFLWATSAAHAQQGPGYNPYYYAPQQAQAQRYYNPYANAGYYPQTPAYAYQAATPTYYYPTYYNPSAYNYPAATPAYYPPAAYPNSTMASSGQGMIQYAPPSQPAPPAIVTAPSPTPTTHAMPPAVPGESGNLDQYLDQVISTLGEPRKKECAWFSASYLAAFISPMRLNGALVTTGSLADNFPGSLGQPSTATLFGNQPVEFNMASGGTLTIGKFLDDRSRYSLEGAAFGIFPRKQSTTFRSDDNGNPLLTRPTFTTDENRQGAYFVAVPTLVAGSTQIDFTSILGGAEINGRYHGCFGNCGSYNLLVGARYLGLEERMRIEDNYRGIGGTQVLFAGNNVDSVNRIDSFRTTNNFIGSQFGSQLAYDGRWVNFTGFGKMGVGATVQKVSIDGSTTGFTAAGSQTEAGGVLALPSNIGTHSQTVFGFLPEVGFTSGLNLCDNLRLKMGYSILFWNSVVRPGSSYGTNVNSALAPTGQNFGNLVGAPAPLFSFRNESFWTQSLNFGLECHY